MSDDDIPHMTKESEALQVVYRWLTQTNAKLAEVIATLHNGGTISDMHAYEVELMNGMAQLLEHRADMMMKSVRGL